MSLLLAPAAKSALIIKSKLTLASAASILATRDWLEPRRVLYKDSTIERIWHLFIVLPIV
jgi:hypothetical protein